MVVEPRKVGRHNSEEIGFSLFLRLQNVGSYRNSQLVCIRRLSAFNASMMDRTGIRSLSSMDKRPLAVKALLLAGSAWPICTVTEGGAASHHGDPTAPLPVFDLHENSGTGLVLLLLNALTVERMRYRSQKNFVAHG